MKQFLILTLFLTCCSTSAVVEENANFVVAQNNSSSNIAQNKFNPVVVQKSNKFQTIIPKAFWEKEVFFRLPSHAWNVNPNNYFRSNTAIVNRLIHTSRFFSSTISMPHTCVDEPICKGFAVPVTIPEFAERI